MPKRPSPLTASEVRSFYAKAESTVVEIQEALALSNAWLEDTKKRIGQTRAAQRAGQLTDQAYTDTMRELMSTLRAAGREFMDILSELKLAQREMGAVLARHR